MLPFFTMRFGNASSIDHQYGTDAADAVLQSRKKIARSINASEDEIVFTSGATEANNIAILGTASKNSEKDHIITCTTEHKSVLDVCEHLEATGHRVTYVPVDSYGIIDLGVLEASITGRTVLISVMAANNEIGTLAPIEEIGRIAHSHDVLFHVDAAQAAGHIPLDVKRANIDFMSISAHKMYGPKGVGLLFVNRENKIKPSSLFFGGGQERGIRSGTLNVAGIVGLAKAFEIAMKEMAAENNRYRDWTHFMLDYFTNNADPVEQNGHPSNRLCHNLNVSFSKVESKALIQNVSSKIAISSGSACTTMKVEPSHVVLALHLGEDRAYSAIRIGVGRFNTEEEIEFAAELISQAVSRLRRISC
jgi:cysteine desulfurase